MNRRQIVPHTTARRDFITCAETPSGSPGERYRRYSPTLKPGHRNVAGYVTEGVRPSVAYAPVGTLKKQTKALGRVRCVVFGRLARAT